MKINILLFNKFETLDAFGPVEIFGKVKEFSIEYFSVMGGLVESSQNFSIPTKPVASAEKDSVLLIPGGEGTRSLVNDSEFLFSLKQAVEKSRFCLSVCTGSALLAKAGLLDGIKATSNKRAFEWVKTNSEKTIWTEHARWTADGKFYTSSGVSAGMDMALGFVADILGKARAKEIARHIEYAWNEDPASDDFSEN